MNVPPHRDGTGWGVTLAFWATLLVAAALFAAVTLAPRLKTLADLRASYAANQLRLVALERQALELERVAEALEHDPRFAAEVAKIEFAAGPAGDERIAMPEELRLGADDETTAAEPPPSAVDWKLPPALLDPLATHAGLRGGLLGAAALLTLVAFTVLHEGQAKTVRAIGGSVAGAARGIVRRYRTG